MLEIDNLYNFQLNKHFVSRLTSTMILESLLLALSPGFYHYLTSLSSAYDELEQKFDKLNRGFSD
jgi:hypothetical protein